MPDQPVRVVSHRLRPDPGSIRAVDLLSREPAQGCPPSRKSQECLFQDGVTFDKASSKCFRTYSIGDDIQRMIQSCLVSRLGERLQVKAAERTANVWPEKHQFVPWVLFNNVSLARSQNLMDDIPSLLCQWYNGDKQIPYCSQQMKKRYRTASFP